MARKYKLLMAAAFLAAGLGASADDHCVADSVDMLAYSSLDGSGGLKLAFKCCKSNEWKPISSWHNFVSSDFGPWGSHKKMFAPSLSQNADGGWTATWIADVDGSVLATAESSDLLSWKPQTYSQAPAERNGISQFVVDDKAVSGSIVRVPKSLVANLAEQVKKRGEKSALIGERMADDDKRFAELPQLSYTVKAQPKLTKKISDKLIGIFFEDINYGADGGLYAELVQNRDFEYDPSDRKGDKNWNSLYAWRLPDKEKGEFIVSVDNPIHPNNPHFLSVDVNTPGFRIINEGYDGIAVKNAEKYDFSMKCRSPKDTYLLVSLVDNHGKTLASGKIDVNSDKWTDYNLCLVPDRDEDNACLVISVAQSSKVDFDMVSLFPQNTFNGRKNGLRKDLAQTLADLQPKFVRFPGGCVAHGDGIDNIYDWKGSVGALEARKPLRNIWNYHQTRGLGYHEYFLFCEDIGAEPLPVLAAGVPCQNSGSPAHHSHDAITSRGQQDGIPMEEMDAYVQDVLDLIEYANGDVSTPWGSKRAEAGHPEPFNLKYIGIGNEDMITPAFETRFKMIYDAVRSKYPEMLVVGTVGPFYEGSDYDEGWRLAKELDIPLVDEHYYVSPGWMIYNQNYYDDYQRDATKVYLGEYAAHVDGRKSNIETALAEALYLTSVERNGDVVEMSSYAPLLAKRDHTQWRPDLIYFTNTEVMPTTDYYVQKLYGNNSGSCYVPAETELSTDNDKALVRVGSSIVRDDITGDVIVKLVNLLPVEVNADVDLAGLKVKDKSPITATIISGTPDDSEATPRLIEFKPKSAKKFAYAMEPYSFTVLRISAKR